MSTSISSQQAELIVADGLCPAIATLLPAALKPVESLGAESEPLQAIGALLQTHPGVQTLHLLAHGAPGGFRIGGQWIDRGALIANTEALGEWGVGRIALWCCETGADREFAALLAELTGAQVLASATALVGGEPEASWRLGEGASAMAAPFQPAQIGSWAHRLGEVVTPIPIASPGRTNQEFRNLYAFAALKADGSVVTWGESASGGDSGAVAAQLSSGVNQIFSSLLAFAALKADGSVVTWGDSNNGGNSSAVAAQLSSGVNQIFSSLLAFAALKADGSVVTWGDSNNGGNSSAVAAQLSSGVTQIFSNRFAFAALKANGSVVTWGFYSGHSSAVAAQLTSGVTQIFSTRTAFAALKANGSVITWGYPTTGGDSSAVAAQLSTGVTQIFSTEEAFAALKANGSVVTWGNNNQGGNSRAVAAKLSDGVTQIFSTEAAFAALKVDGSVVTWGASDYGGNSSGINGELAFKLSAGVTQIFSTERAFAALKSDGSVVTWGTDRFGGNSNAVAAQLSSGVTQVFASGGAFAALRTDGSVVTWGDTIYGGDSSAVAARLASGVAQIFSTDSAFAALKADGSVVTWGSSGGDSSTVSDQLSSGVVGFANPFTDDRLTLGPTSTTAGITTVTDNVGVIQGIVAQAISTDDTRPVISGYLTDALSKSESLLIFNGTTLLGTATVKNSNRTWRFTPSLPPTAGTIYSITARVADAAGNLGVASIPRIFTLDTISPLTIAAISTATDNVGLIKGQVPLGGRTDDTTPTISGTLTAALASGETLRIFNRGTLLGTATVNNSTKTWSFTPTLPVTPGTTYSITTRVADAAGNLGVASAQRSFTLDTAAPVFRVVTPKPSNQEFGNGYAFAAVKADGSVVTWGNFSYGANSSAVAAQLSSGVTQIFSCGDAFAALKADGSVVTWGVSTSGGDSSAVAAQLSAGVTQIFSTYSAFAALKANGSVVTWGRSGGNSSGVAVQLSSGVTQIFSTAAAFAALKADDSVVTWGDSSSGGDSNGVAATISSGVTKIFSTGGAFAALKADGSVVTWGNWLFGGDSSNVATKLSSGVTQIFSTRALGYSGAAFAALKADGSVVTWGDPSSGGNSNAVAASLSSGVAQIFSTRLAFAALKLDGSVVTWGDSFAGGNSSAVAAGLSSGVTQIFSAEDAFAALKADGSVVTWGVSATGPYSPSRNSWLASKLSSGVAQIFSSGNAFAALKLDGSVVTWGVGSEYFNRPVDNSAVSSQLTSGVTQIFSAGSAFAALKADGSVVTWGLPSYDSVSVGNTRAVAGKLSSGVVGFANPFTDERLLFPVISNIVDTTGLIQGSLVPGGSTDDFTPTILGSLPANIANGETLRIFNGSTLLGTAAVNKTTKTWSYTPTLPATAGTTYSITARIADAAGNLGLASPARTFSLDTVAPSVVSFSPLDGAIGVDLAANISLTFSEGMQRGSGAIQLRTGSATGPIIESFDAATSTRLSLSGSGLTINPTSPLAPNTQYFLTFPAGSLIDRAGNPFAGTSTYDFRTTNVVSGTPANDILSFTSTVDRLTGLAGADTFRLTSLSHSRLPANPTTPIDRITDLVTGIDSIDAPVARSQATALNPTALGAVLDLSAAGIAALFTPASFPALTTTSSGGAATFTFETRTFLAINDGVAGFSPTSDSILEITGFSGTLNQLRIF